jgi:glycosyltransferase involved in cell wall biosynthesis
MLVARACAVLSRWIPGRIVTPSRMAIEIHAAFGYVAGKFEIIPNGYDAALFAPDERARRRLRDEWRIRPAEFLFGMVARFDAQKDHANLFSALTLVQARHSEVRVVLVGPGMTEENRALFDDVDRIGLRPAIIALGPRNDVPAIMSAIDTHVLSSAYGEAFPNVVAEAMACGTPCIATDVGDAALMIGETGWVVPPRDPPALAEAMLAAIDARNDHRQWEARRSACRERVAARFAMEAMVAGYASIWDEEGV